MARGYSYDIEPYIINYISSVVSGEYESLFGKFTDVFADGNFTPQIELLKNTLTQLDVPQTFNSIINMDVHFFGLVYFILFEKKSIDTSKKEDLKSEIESVIQDFRDNTGHSNAPAQFQYMRQRITKSVETYQKYLQP